MHEGGAFCRRDGAEGVEVLTTGGGSPDRPNAVPGSSGAVLGDGGLQEVMRPVGFPTLATPRTQRAWRKASCGMGKASEMATLWRHYAP